MHVFWTETSAVQNFLSICIESVGPFAACSKLTVILQEVLADVQVGTGCFIFTTAIFANPLVVVGAHLDKSQKTRVTYCSHYVKINIRCVCSAMLGQSTQLL